MEFIDLHTGFVLLGFDTHQELMRAAMLCKLKGKNLLFGRTRQVKGDQGQELGKGRYLYWLSGL